MEIFLTICYNQKKPCGYKAFVFVQEMGLEPTRRNRHQILSLACLPIPALLQILFIQRTITIIALLLFFVNNNSSAIHYRERNTT